MDVTAPLSPNYAALPTSGSVLVTAPSIERSISLGLDAVRLGVFDAVNVPAVDPRDEQITKLHERIREIEQKDTQNKDEVGTLKSRLEQLEKEISPPRDVRAVNPSFDDLCKELEHWIPRCSRRFEEAYKAELAQYLSGRFLRVEEEARGQLCDILIASRYPIHLKVNPSVNAYNTLSGQVLATLQQFDQVACMVLGVGSQQRFDSFVSTLRAQVADADSKIRFFPKAR